MKKKTLKIAFIRTSSLGDVILSTSCLQILQKLACPVEVYWLGSEPTLSLLKASFPQIIPIHVSRKERAGVSKEHLKTLGNMDLIFDMQVNPRSRILTSILRLKHQVNVVTLPKERHTRSMLVVRSYLASRIKKTTRRGVDLNSTNHFKQYLKHNKVFLEAIKKLLPLLPPYENLIETLPCLPMQDDRFEFSDEMKFTNWIAIAPGARYSAKRAPVDLYLKIVQELQHAFVQTELNSNDFGIVFLGDKNDRILCQSILHSSNWEGRTLDLSGQLSLLDSAKALRHSKILLCNDSALLHLAEATRTPAAALFGPTVEEFGFAPYLKESSVFSSNLGCRPCSKHGKKPCRFNDYLCFKKLNPAAIAKTIADLAFE